MCLLQLTVGWKGLISHSTMCFSFRVLENWRGRVVLRKRQKSDKYINFNSFPSPLSILLSNIFSCFTCNFRRMFKGILFSCNSNWKCHFDILFSSLITKIWLFFQHYQLPRIVSSRPLFPQFPLQIGRKCSSLYKSKLKFIPSGWKKN